MPIDKQREKKGWKVYALRAGPISCCALIPLNLAS